MDDLLREFLTETNESLDLVDVELVRFEQDPNNAKILDNIFRLVHTIKGTCGFLGLPRLEALAHAAETLMGKFRDGMVVTGEAVTLILFTIDRITHRTAPIYHSTYTGRPPDEPAILGVALNEVFVPVLKKQFPEIVDFYLPPEGCSYRFAVVTMKKQYPGHAKRVMFGVWSFLRQLTYTQFLVVTDEAKRAAISALYKKAFKLYSSDPNMRSRYDGDSEDLRAKQLSVQPAFAALIVTWLKDAGVRRGDRVAVRGSHAALPGVDGRSAQSEGVVFEVVFEIIFFVELTLVDVDLVLEFLVVIFDAQFGVQQGSVVQVLQIHIIFEGEAVQLIFPVVIVVAGEVEVDFDRV